MLQRPPRRPSPGPGPGASAQPLDLPERVEAGAVAGPRSADPGAAPDRPPALETTPARPAPALTPAARAARRRRIVLVVLLLTTAAGAGVGPVLGADWWVVAGVGGVATVLFLTAARRAVRRDAAAGSGRPRAARRSAPVAAATSPAAAPRPTATAEPGAAAAAPRAAAAGPAAPVPAAAQAVPQLFDQELLEDEPCGARRGAARVAEPAATAGRGRRAGSAEPTVEPFVPAPRRRRPPLAPDGTWTPVPVPTPTYLTAPRVPYPSTPRRPAPATRPARHPQVARQRSAGALGVRRAVGT